MSTARVRIDDNVANEEFEPFRPVQRSATLPSRIPSPPRSAMRRNPHPYDAGASVVTGLEGRSGILRGLPKTNLTALEEIHETPNHPITINNYYRLDPDALEEAGRRSDRHDSRRPINRPISLDVYGQDDDNDDEYNDYNFHDAARHRDDDSHGYHSSEFPTDQPEMVDIASIPSDVSSSEEDDDCDEDDSLLFHRFKSPYVVRPSQTADPSVASVSSSTTFLSKVEAQVSQKQEMMHIYKARYVGDPVEGARHACKLTVLNHAARHQKELYRWLHIKQPIMSFDGFWNAVADISDLTNPEKSGIKKLLEGIKRDRIKSTKTVHGPSRVMDWKGVMTQKLLGDQEQFSTSPPRTIRWFNIPFFQLKKYSSAKATSEMFPDQTLMQAEFSQHSEHRDMQQAVRQTTTVADGYCYHIPQLWAIVVDNSLLVTCSTLPIEPIIELGGDRIAIKRLPQGDNEGSEPRILVEYLGNTVWALPLKDCYSWFHFITHFWEFWPSNVQFYRHGKLVSPDVWPRIVASVQQGEPIKLRASIRPPPSLPARGVLATVTAPHHNTNQQATSVNENNTNNQSASAEPRARTPAPPDKLPSDGPVNDPEIFSIFSWMKPSPGKSRKETARIELDRIDHLLRKRRLPSYKAYIECPEVDYNDIHSELDSLAHERKILDLPEKSKLRQSLEFRIDTFNAAVMIFTFYLPLDFTGPSIRKFWGALKLLLDRPWPEDNDDSQELKYTTTQKEARYYLSIVRKVFRRASRHIRMFQQTMSHAPDSFKSGLQIPDQFLQSYIFFLLTIIHATRGDFQFESQMSLVEEELADGMRAVLKLASPPSLSTFSSVLPTEILSLISSNLLGHGSQDPLDIRDIYSDRVQTLKDVIETKPALSHQEKIQWLKAEVMLIIKVLREQTSIFDSVISGSYLDPRVVPRSARPAPQYEHTRDREYYASAQTSTSRYRTAERRLTYPPLTASELRERSRSVHNVQAPRSNRLQAYQPATYDTNHSVSSEGQYEHDSETGLKLSPTDPKGFRDLLARECKSIIDQRLNDFEQFKWRATTLERTNAQGAETRKSYQDQAIYAFTIVTVIFLPLSAISSIFGMNTSDIRDMEQGQWLYWATAVPVTVSVILIGLWWIGELGSFAAWLATRHPQKPPVSSRNSDDKSDPPIRPYPKRRAYRERMV